MFEKCHFSKCRTEPCIPITIIYFNKLIIYLWRCFKYCFIHILTTLSFLLHQKILKVIRFVNCKENMFLPKNSFQIFWRTLEIFGHCLKLNIPTEVFQNNDVCVYFSLSELSFILKPAFLKTLYGNIIKLRIFVKLLYTLLFFTMSLLWITQYNEKKIKRLFNGQ